MTSQATPDPLARPARQPPAPAAAITQGGVPPAERLLFLVLLAVLGARPLISESFQRVSLSFLPPEAELGTTPATTVWLDMILLVAAVCTLAGSQYSAVGRQVSSGLRGPTRCSPPVARCWPVIAGSLLMAVAVAISAAAAGDKRAAANAGAHLCVMVLAGAALARLMRARWMVRLLLAAILAGGITNAVKCISQRVDEYPDLLEYWEEHKAALAARGAALDAPVLIDYERRLRSCEATGYLSHPNLTASCLALCLLVAGGLLIGLWRPPGTAGAVSARPSVPRPGAAPDPVLAGRHWLERWAPTATAAAAVILLAGGLWLTGSVGAMTAAVVGAVLLLLLGTLSRWVADHLRLAFGLLVVAYVAVIAAGIGYGLLRGTLPHTSLAFRWEYWQAAARAAADTPFTGCGRENFGAAYLLHKSPASTEEVRNPHNVWVSLLVELGPLGLLAGVLLTGAVTWAALRGLRSTAGSEGPEDMPGAAAPAARRPGWELVAAALGVLLVAAGFCGQPFGSEGVLLLWAVYVGAVWAAAFLGCHLLLRAASGRVGGSRWLAASLGAALYAMLVHNLIDFSLMTPAGLACLVSLAAAGWAGERAPVALEGRPVPPRPQGADAARLPRAFGPLGFRFSGPLLLGAGAVGLYAWCVAIPSIRTESARQRIVRELRAAPSAQQAWATLVAGLTSLGTDPWEADLPVELGEAALGLGTKAAAAPDVRREWFTLAERYAEQAVQRNPRSFAARVLLARVRQQQAAASAEPGLLEAAAERWDEAVRLYPTNPRTRIEAGQAWYRAWEATGWPDHGRRALHHALQALAIDATRKPEVAAKLRPRELRLLHGWLANLESAGFEPTDAQEAPAPGAPSSPPARP